MLRLERWANRLFRRREQGSAMVMALIALTLGMLVITPALNYMSTGSKAAAIYMGDTSELYAADAGVEYAIWRIKNGLPVEPSITVGGIPVTISVSQLTELPYGPVLSDTGPQSWRLQVLTAMVSNGNGIFTLTITVKNVGPSTIHLTEIGTGIPDGFTYVTGSTSGDITTTNPSFPISSDMPTWTLGLPALNSEQTLYHIFRIQGVGSPEGYYSWVKANASSVGIISGCFGYNIVSQANGGTTITANAAGNAGALFPVSWQVNA